MLDLAPNGRGIVRVADVMTGGSALPPVPISPYSTLSLPAYWRAMAFVADNLSSFPRSVRRDGAATTGGQPQAKPLLDRLLRRKPNGYQNPFTFWRAWYFHAAHVGNGYARVERDPATYRPVALHNLMPEDVYPFRFVPPGATAPEQYYLLWPNKTVLLGADVLHLRTLSHDAMTGIGPVSLHESTFQRAATLDRYQTRYLQKGSVIRGAIEIPTAVPDERITQITDVLRSYFRGPDNERDVMVLPDGAKLNNATISPQQSQIVEQVAQTTKAVAQITGVPPEFLFELSEAKYNASVEQQGQNVVRYLFRPWIEQAEDELTLKLLADAEQEAGYTVRVNPDALLRGDTRTQSANVIAEVNAGVRTANEGRALLGLPKLADPDADRLKTLGDSTPAQQPEPK